MKKLMILGVLGLSGVTALWMLPARALNSHECFVSVTAREMLATNDYVWPTLNGAARLQKTPLCYWLVAGVGRVTGRVDELSARLPSALCAILSSLVIFYYVGRWMSPRIGALSACVWATSLTYMRCSHSARPDMVMTFFIIVCMLSFYDAATASERRRQVFAAIVFWVSFAAANLAKGPAPVAYVAVALGAYIVVTRRWRVIGRMLPVAGSLIFLLVVVPWVLFVGNRLNWDLTLWKHEYFDRLFGSYRPGHFPIYYYVGQMFKYFTPWIAFWPIALFTPFYKVWEEKRPVMMYMWIWFVADFLFVSIDGGKRQHYIVPLIAPMAILTGVILEDMIFSRKAYPLQFAKNTLWGHGIVLVCGAAAGPIVVAFVAPQFFWGAMVLSGATIVFAAVSAVVFAKGRREWAVSAVFSGIAIFAMLSSYNFSEASDGNASARDFARKIASIVPATDELIGYRSVSGRFVQYYGRVVPRVSEPAKLMEYYEEGYWIVCLSEFLESMDKDGLCVAYSCEPEDDDKPDSGGVLFHKPGGGEASTE